MCFYGSYFATADNLFRIYVNGVLSPGAVFGGGMANCSNQPNWNGDNWQIGFGGTFSNLLHAGNNQFIVEVLNGAPGNGQNHPMWFDGRISIASAPAATSTFNHSLVENQGFFDLTLSNTGIGLSQTWLIETSSSSSGPWNFLSSNTNQRLGGSQTFQTPLCTWTRVTHTVTLGTCTSVTTLVFKQCGGPENKLKEEKFESYNVLTESESGDAGEFYTIPLDFNPLVNKYTMDGSPDSFEKSNAENQYFDIYPNPSNGHISVNFKGEENEIYKITLLDNIGRTVLESELFQGQNNWKASNLPSGMIIAKICDSSGKISSVKKVFIKN